MPRPTQVSQDPTEEFFAASQPLSMRAVVSDTFPEVQPYLNMTTRPPHPLASHFKWDLRHLSKLHLWGPPTKEPEESSAEQFQKQRDDKHQRSLQLASPRRKIRAVGKIARAVGSKYSPYLVSTPSDQSLFKVPALDLLTISPPRKGKIRAQASMIGFQAFHTIYDASKSPSDPWVLVTTDLLKKLWISNWEVDVPSTGWLGSGHTKHGIKVRKKNPIILRKISGSSPFLILHLQGASSSADWAFVQHSDASLHPGDVKQELLSCLAAQTEAEKWMEKFAVQMLRLHQNKKVAKKDVICR
jgi:hypothetical protein